MNHIGSMIQQREAFGDALTALGEEYPNLVVLDADVGPSTQTARFAKAFPNRFYQIGIAEQNMAGIAAGMANAGLIPYISTFAVFMAHRAGDQIRNAIAHPQANVKINGGYAGLPTGRAGATHSSVEDVAVMRALPNMMIFEPADDIETAQFIRISLEYNGPVYIRTVRCAIPTIFDSSYRAVAGTGILLTEGQDVTLISTGMMTARALQAAELLSVKGIRAAVLHMPTIKPFDEESVVAQAKKTGKILTVENHSVIGGLGSAVCETISEKYPCTVWRSGYQDIFLESGDDELLFDRYGLTANRIAERAEALARS